MTMLTSDHVITRQYARYLSLFASVIASLTFVNRTEYDTGEFRAAETTQTCPARAWMFNQSRTSSSRSLQASALLQTIQEPLRLALLIRNPLISLLLKLTLFRNGTCRHFHLCAIGVQPTMRSGSEVYTSWPRVGRRRGKREDGRVPSFKQAF